MAWGEHGRAWFTAVGTALSFCPAGLAASSGDRLADGSGGQPSRGDQHEQVPQVRLGDVDASRGIPVDVIRRIVGQSYGRYRACYGDGLKRDPKLQGNVAVSFVIDQEGKAPNSRDGGSTLPDAAVVRCIVNAVAGLAFPKPQGDWAPPEGEAMKVLMQLWLAPGS